MVLAKEKYGIRGREMAPLDAHFIPFSAQTRISGVDIDGSAIRKGAVDAVLAYVQDLRGGIAAAAAAGSRRVGRRPSMRPRAR